MNKQLLTHDGYMQRLVSKAIYMCQTYTLIERRRELFLLYHHSRADYDDLALVLNLVFILLKHNKQPKYHKGMWPTVFMVRERLQLQIQKQAVQDDLAARAKLYR